MIDATQTMSDCDGLRFSLALPTPRSHLFDREVFCQHYPVLNKILQFADDCADGNPAAAICMMVKRQLFAPLLAPEESQAMLWVHRLPDACESTLVELAASPVDVFNHPSIDLERYLCYSAWRARLDANAATEIWLPAYILEDYFSRNADAQGVSSSFEGCQFSPQYHPILMVSGQTVAVGGFWEDESLYFVMQATEMVAGSHDPRMECTLEELTIAQNADDPTPWRQGMYTMEDHMHVIEPRAYDFASVDF